MTPYLVRPSSGQLATPVDGYRAPTDMERVAFDQNYMGVSGARQPTAIPAPGPVPAPAVSAPAAGAVAASPGFKL